MRPFKVEAVLANTLDHFLSAASICQPISHEQVPGFSLCSLLTVIFILGNPQSIEDLEEVCAWTLKLLLKSIFANHKFGGSPK